jgi:dTDP-4-dehydrorhamnose reductase
MKVWVLGANGMLGSALIKFYKEAGIVAVGSDHLHADITDVEGLKKRAEEINASHIVNCAAFTDVDGAEKLPHQAYLINAQGAENVARIAKERGAHLIHLSTDYVFDGVGIRPYLETDPCSPINCYGKSKREGEERIVAVDPSACILRTSWLFGPKGKNFISSIFSLLQKQEEIRVASDQIGRPTFCKDLAQAILSLHSFSGIIHFANENEASRYAIAQEIFHAAKNRGVPLACKSIVAVSAKEFITPAARPAYSVLSLTKIQAVLGVQVRPWQAALQEYLQESQAS